MHVKRDIPPSGFTLSFTLLVKVLSTTRFSSLGRVPCVFQSLLATVLVRKYTTVQHISCLDHRLSGTYTGRWFTPESRQLIFECVNVCVPSSTTYCANLDLLLRMIQSFLGLGGAALWSLLQLSTTMLRRGCFTVNVHNHYNPPL